MNVGAVAFSPTIVDSNRFSSWKKLVRAMTWVLRMKRKFLAKIKQTNESQMCQGPLSAQELEEGRKYVIKHAQRSLQNCLVNNEFKMLSPFVDDEGIIRVGGRVDKAIVSYETKHPVLLPHDHIVSSLIIQEAHWCGHPGVATTVAKTRTNYWIVRGHNLAKAVKYKCVFCREMEPKTETQIMADLPQHRTSPDTSPFHYT